MDANRGFQNGSSEDQDMAKIMGFSGFGGSKKAKTFDFMAMFEETRKTAIERSKKNTDADVKQPSKKGSSSSGSGSDSESDDAGPPLPPSMKRASAGPSSSKVQDDEDDDDMVGPPLPAGMKISSKAADSDDDEIGPPLPPGMQNRLEEEDDEEGEDLADDNPLKKIPDSLEIKLDHGRKTVSALALDPAGARLVSGGFDYDVKFWDFAGMDASFQSFRNLRPCECHPIKSLEYSATGDAILVVAGNAQAKVIDRDGFEMMECPRGDQYINDMARTKGHAAMLNSGCWHPKIKDEFMTCSNDCTVRLWNTNSEKKQKQVIKPRSQQGRKTIPTTCTYSRDGRWVAAGCQDGSIQIWDHNKSYVNIAMHCKTAHQNGSDISSLCFSYDGKTLASRGCDDTLKLWDIRQFKTPLNVKKNLTNFYPMTDCTFSPDDKLVVTGISVRKDEGKGKILFMDRETLDTVYQIEGSSSSVVRCIWHPKLNQVVTSSANGEVKIYYDPDKSQRGAMLCVVKKKKKTKQVEAMFDQNIITPHALPMFRQDRPKSTRKQLEKDRKDPIKSHRPDLPVAGQGVGGRVGAKGATLSQYVCQQIVKRAPDERDFDPRAAILRHAEEAAKNPFWVDPAYKDTQPKAIYLEEKDDNENKKEGDLQPAWKKAKYSKS